MEGSSGEGIESSGRGGRLSHPSYSEIDGLTGSGQAQRLVGISWIKPYKLPFCLSRWSSHASHDGGDGGLLVLRVDGGFWGPSPKRELLMAAMAALLCRSSDKSLTI